MARKGLFHIVEIVIITLIMFVVISQTTYIPGTGVDWSGPKLMTLGRDALFSMEEMGMDWSDEGKVRDYLNYSFGDTRIRYSLEYKGVPKESIGVGCLCDGTAGCVSFCNDLDDLLSDKFPASFNNFTVEISAISTTSISNIFDVIVTNQDLSGSHEGVRNFLSAGKGFVLVRDLDQYDFDSYGDTLREFFSVDFEPGPGSGSFVRFNMAEAETYPEYYGILNYFSSIPNGTGDRYNTSQRFEAFSSDDAKRMDGRYGRVILQNSLGSAASIAKDSATGSQGRTAWLSGSSQEEDWSVYLASLVVWSSDHNRPVTGDDMSRAAATVSVYSIPDDTSRPDFMFQPIEVSLSMGYLYS